MYESMKAKDAAKIFDGLDMRVLIDVAKAINPRTMSEILAQMLPENAQRLTVELAARPAPKDAAAQAADLPKIQGTPTPNWRRRRTAVNREHPPDHRLPITRFCRQIAENAAVSPPRS